MIYLNPFSYVVWVYQDVLFFGAVRTPVCLGDYRPMCFAEPWGLVIARFERLKPYYGNAL